MRELLRVAVDLTWLVWLAGGVGFIAGVIALALTVRKSSWSLWAGLVALGLAAVTASLAAMEFQHKRSLGDRFVQPVKEDKSWSRVRGDERRRAAYVDARNLPLVGAGAASLPLLMGLIATWVSLARRRGELAPLAKDRMGPPAQVLVGTMPEAPRQSVAGGLLLPGGFSLVCVLGVGATGALALAPLPEPDIDLRDPLWGWLSAIERVQQNNDERGCDTLVFGLESLAQRRAKIASQEPDFTPASTKYLGPDYPVVVHKCVEARIALAMSIQEPDIRSAVLHSFENPRCTLKPDPAQQKRVDEELARLPPPRPDLCACWGEPRFKNPYDGCAWRE